MAETWECQTRNRYCKAKAKAEIALQSAEKALSWALDLLDMYDERLAGIDGEEKVYTPMHLQGKEHARKIQEALLKVW